MRSLPAGTLRKDEVITERKAASCVFRSPHRSAEEPLHTGQIRSDPEHLLTGLTYK